MKIVINRCFGGFGVTKAVYDELGLKWDNYGFLDNKAFDIESDNCMEYRANEYLINAIEKIGLKESADGCAKLKIIEIPDNIKWEIYEYDGLESIHEVHKSWS